MTSVGVMASAVNVATGLPYALWLDATDTATFTYTATPPQVATWTDKSGAGYTFVPGTPGTGVIRNATINGLTAVNFNGNFQQMSCNDIDVRTFVDPVNFTDCMAFFVMRFSDTTRQDLSSHGNTGTPRIAFDFRATTNIDIGNNTTARLTGTTTVAAATPYLYAAYRNGATMKLVRNGTELLSRSDASAAMTSLPGADIILGRAGNCRLDLGEMIIVAGYNATQFTAVQAALKAKWGTA